MEDARPRVAGWWLTGIAFLSGGAVMVFEMAAVRAMAPYFGTSTYTWTNVIGVILAALSAGYFIGGRWIDRRPSPALLCAVLVGGGLLGMAMPLLVGPLSRTLLPVADSVEGAVSLAHRSSLVATLLLCAPPVFLLGMVSPMAIRLLAVPGRVGDASGRVFAASTVGSICGTFATTFWLVPAFGSRWTLALAGGLLVFGGATGLALLVRSRRSTAAAVGAAAGAALLLLGAAAAGPQKDADGQVAEAESAYQYLRVLDVPRAGGGVERFLQINEAETAYQSVLVEGSALTDGRYYDYYSVLPLLLSEDARRDLDVLVVGFATGTIARQLHHFHPEGLTVTGVEIDPKVVELGERHFDLDRDATWLDLHVADGRVFLNRLPPEVEFDLVVVDAFAEEFYIPFHLATAEAFRKIGDHLAPGGILAMNVSTYRADAELLGAIESTLAHVFGAAWRAPVLGYPNWMLFAMKDGEPDRRRLYRPPEKDVAEWDALMDLAHSVGVRLRTIKEGPGPILTDDRAPVERLIDRQVAAESRLILGE